MPITQTAFCRCKETESQQGELRARHAEPDPYADGLTAVPSPLRAVVREALVADPAGRIADATRLVARLSEQAGAETGAAAATLTEPHEEPRPLLARGELARGVTSTGAALAAPAEAPRAGKAATSDRPRSGAERAPSRAVIGGLGVGAVAMLATLLAGGAAVEANAGAVCDSDRVLVPGAWRAAACRSAIGRAAYLDVDRARRLHTLAGLLERAGDTREALLVLGEGAGACKWTSCSNVGDPIAKDLARLCRDQTRQPLARGRSWAVVTARHDPTDATLRSGPSFDASPVGQALSRGRCVQAGEVRAVGPRDAFVAVVLEDGRAGFVHVDMLAPVQRYVALAPTAPSSSTTSEPAPSAPALSVSSSAPALPAATSQASTTTKAPR